MLASFLSKSMSKINKFLSEHISDKSPGDFNQALMDLGREICTPKNPQCLECPISDHCKSYLMNQVSKYPIKSNKKKIFPHYDIGVGVIWHEDKILITKRKKNGLLGGLWEFPGGKIRPKETKEACIKREIKEELGIDIDISNFIAKVNHKYSHFAITLYAYHCHYKGGTIRCNSADNFKWIKLNNFSNYPFPKANHHLFPHITNLGSVIC